MVNVGPLITDLLTISKDCVKQENMLISKIPLALNFVFSVNQVKYMKITALIYIYSRFIISQIINHSDYLKYVNDRPTKGQGHHQKINFFKHWYHREFK